MTTCVNQRRCVRTSFICRVGISTRSGEMPFEASSLDISLGGVGLISPKLVPVGNEITLTFHLRTPSQIPVSESIRGRVVFAQSDLDGHRLGVEFAEMLHTSRNPHLARRVERL